MEIRVWKSQRVGSPYLLVHHSKDTGEYRITYTDGREYPHTLSVVNSHKWHHGGLWGQCREMGSTIEEILNNIDAEILLKQKEKEAHRRALEERKRAETEAEEKRKSLVCSVDRMTIRPSDIMNRMEDAERVLEQMKPGSYHVVINYKNAGAIELKRKARTSDSQHIAGIVEREDKQTHASLHRFASAVRKCYEGSTELIGRTHAIKSFGHRLVDSIPCVKEMPNNYYSSAAPRRLYDKQTLLYMKVQDYEKYHSEADKAYREIDK